MLKMHLILAAEWEKIIKANEIKADMMVLWSLQMVYSQQAN